ncbi:MAG: hypothetical protein PW788_02015 [Micavibrio sp.]|nr:hypothetical protein [Micavibrio sp.]
MRKPFKNIRATATALRFVLPVVAFGFLAVPATSAFAQCETSPNAQNEFKGLADDIVDELNNFITQEENFITELVTHRAKYEMVNRLFEFDTNIRAALTAWWNDDLLPAMKQQTQQLSTDQVDQSRTLGSLLDAQIQNEAVNDINQQQVQSQRMYEPNEMTCMVDSLTVGDGGTKGITKARKLSVALTGASAKDDQKRRANAKGSPSEAGVGAEMNWTWQQYVAKFCDPDMGDQGCTTAGDADMAGKHVNLPGLLWGNKQTIDMSNQKNVDIVEAVKRYFINPTSPNPIPAAALKSSAGQEMMLDRRSSDARLNTIYNAIGQMISERSSGSGVDTKSIRASNTVTNPDTSTTTTGAGLPDEDASNDASYRELMTAMSVDRYHDPAYITRMVQYPEATVREMGSINAIKMQQMNDIYKRQEEMLFMEAAMYASTLDGDKPKSGSGNAPQH